VKVLRSLSLAVFAMWVVGGLAAMAYNLDSPQSLASPMWVDVVITASGLYLFCIGFVLQLLGKLR
jgi:phosphatidylcholine synthase